MNEICRFVTWRRSYLAHLVSSPYSFYKKTLCRKSPKIFARPSNACSELLIRIQAFAFFLSKSDKNWAPGSWCRRWWRLDGFDGRGWAWELAQRVPQSQPSQWRGPGTRYGHYNSIFPLAFLKEKIIDLPWDDASSRHCCPLSFLPATPSSRSQTF